VKKSQSFFLITALIFLMLRIPAFADTVTITFEGMPGSYVDYYSPPNPSDNGANIGNYFSSLGVNFGQDATILDSSRSSSLYPSSAYPAVSGTAVMTTLSSDPNYVGNITASFNNPTNYVSVWFTTDGYFYLEAYNLGGNMITFASFESLFGNTGSNGMLQVSTPGYDIAYVIMHDGGGLFTVDDFTFNVPVAEPGTILLLGCGLIGLGLAGLRKKFRK